MRIVIGAFFVVLFSSPVQAQQTSDEIFADRASWVGAIGLGAYDTIESFQCDDKTRCFEMQAARVLLTGASVYTLKKLIHRARPCAPDKCGRDGAYEDFPSGHTTFAFVSIGRKSVAVTIPAATLVGEMRIGAKKHTPLSVLLSALMGTSISFIR